MISIVKNIIVHLSADLKDSRNAKSVASAIEKLLYVEGLHSVRMIAFDTLMLFIETVPEYEEGWKVRSTLPFTSLLLSDPNNHNRC